MAKQNKPAIRFKEFTDAWEQRKLGEVATFINGRAYSQPELLSSGKYKVLRVGNFYTNDSWYYSDLELGEKYYADYGDLLYTWSATFGPHIWLGDRVIYHYHIWKINLSDQLEKQFAVQLLEQDRTNILSSKNGSTMVHITKEGMEQKDVIIPPSTKEQQEIGAFFLQLDHLITLHQRKYDKLQVLKKAMLEKMFPKNGSSVPEIRFKGFTDAWEQRKAKDLCSISTGKSNTQDRVDDGIYPFYVRSPIVEHSNRYLFDEEAVLTVGDGVGTGKVFHYVNGKYDLHQRVYRMFDFSEEITAKYFYYYFSNHFYDRVMSMTAKTSVDSVRYEMIADMDIALPKVKEQMAISAYFDRLDHLITLHQRELEKLQNIKKSMLEKMFV